jgi:hypothetical protein
MKKKTMRKNMMTLGELAAKQESSDECANRNRGGSKEPSVNSRSPSTCLHELRNVVDHDVKAGPSSGGVFKYQVQSPVNAEPERGNS